jgi:DNA polymerase III delta subunit
VATDLRPVYLLGGSDAPKVARAVARLRARFPADAVERLTAPESSGPDAVAACNALGLFGGGGRLVEVSRVELWKAADVRAIAEYAANPAPDTVLALVAEEMKRDAPLAKASAKTGEVLLYDVAKRDLPKWAADQFARLDARADAEACRALVELAGDNLGELELEIEKLVVWAAGEEIRAADVAALVAPRGDAPPFALTDALGKRDLAAALAACEAQLEHAADVRRELTRLAGLVAGHVGRLRDVQRREGAGQAPRDAAVELKRHRFYVEKLFAQARNFSVDELRAAIVELARLDLALKGASRVPGELELERAVIAVARPAAGAPALAPTR